MNASEALQRRVGLRIAAARKKRGLSQRAFAAVLGWPHGTLANYESGRRRLTLTQLAHIANACERSPASFLIESPTAALLLERLGSDEILARQVAYFLITLDDQLPNPPS